MASGAQGCGRWPPLHLGLLLQLAALLRTPGLQVQSLRPESLLLVSTLDGSLHALSKQTGDLKWTLKDDPILQGPMYVTETAFLSDPADGSLYVLGTQKQQGLMPKQVQRPSAESSGEEIDSSCLGELLKSRKGACTEGRRGTCGRFGCLLHQDAYGGC